MTPLDIESLREHHLTPLERELLDHVERLTGERDRAREAAITTGAFTSMEGDESVLTHAMNDECEVCGSDYDLHEYCWGIANPPVTP